MTFGGKKTKASMHEESPVETRSAKIIQFLRQNPFGRSMGGCGSMFDSSVPSPLTEGNPDNHTGHRQPEWDTCGLRQGTISPSETSSKPRPLPSKYAVVSTVLPTDERRPLFAEEGNIPVSICHAEVVPVEGHLSVEAA
jgi:hypothetical protein